MHIDKFDRTMNIRSDLERMKDKWEALGIKKHFSEVHHFSSEKFRTKPSGLKGFYNWCQEREILDENLQTLNRALKAASLIEQGQSIESAIKSSWDLYPIVKR
jgi:hypothetical protein